MLYVAPLADLIRRNQTTPVHGSVTVLLAWIAAVDDTVDERECSVLAEAGLRQQPGTQALVEIGESKDLRSIALALSILAAEPEEVRQGTLELCILVALADHVLRYSEIHALTLVAEALRLTVPGGLDRTFRKMTGRPLPELGDPGRRGHWDDEAGRQRSGGGPRGAPPPRDEVDVERMQALATLGLSGDPTREEIKAAYRRLVKVHHPDKFAQLGPDATKAAQEVFLRLHAAYERLMP